MFLGTKREDLNIMKTWHLGQQLEHATRSRATGTPESAISPPHQDTLMVPARGTARYFVCGVSVESRVCWSKIRGYCCVQAPTAAPQFPSSPIFPQIPQILKALLGEFIPPDHRLSSVSNKTVDAHSPDPTDWFNHPSSIPRVSLYWPDHPHKPSFLVRG